MACFLQRRGDWNLHLQVRLKKEERKDKAFSPPSSLKLKTFSKERRPKAIKRAKRHSSGEESSSLSRGGRLLVSSISCSALCVISLLQRGREKYKRIRENSNAHIKWEPERRIETRSRNFFKSQSLGTQDSFNTTKKWQGS